MARVPLLAYLAAEKYSGSIEPFQCPKECKLIIEYVRSENPLIEAAKKK